MVEKKKPKNIKLGSKVRCKWTGFEGIAVGKTTFINGCVQYLVAPRCKENKMEDEVGIDVDSLEVIKNPSQTEKPTPTGGPSKKIKMRGY